MWQGHSLVIVLTGIWFFFCPLAFLRDDWKTRNVSSEIKRSIYNSPPADTPLFPANSVTFEWQQTLSSSHWFLRSTVCPLPPLLVIWASVQAAGPPLPAVTSFCVPPCRLGSFFRKGLNIVFPQKDSPQSVIFNIYLKILNWNRYLLTYT